MRDAGITHAFSFYGGYRRRGDLDPLDIPRTYVGPTLSSARFRAGVTLPRVFCRPARGVPRAPDPSARPAAWGGMVRRGIVWSVAAFGASKALSLISLLVLAGLLAPDEFGVVAAVAAYIALIELGSDIGMKPAIVYEQEEGVSARVQTAFTLNLLTAVALTALGVLLAPAVAGFFGVTDSAGLFRLGALNLLFTGLGNVHDALAAARHELRAAHSPAGRARRRSRRRSRSASRWPGSAPLALVVGFLAGTAAWTAWQWRLTPLRPRLSYDGAIARSLIAYGAPGRAAADPGHRSTPASTWSSSATSSTAARSASTASPTACPRCCSRASPTRSEWSRSRRWRAGGHSDPALLGDATLQLAALPGPLRAAGRRGAGGAVEPDRRSALLADLARGGAPAGPIAVAAALYTVVFPLGDLLKAVGRQATIVKINVILIPLMIAACPLAAPAGVLAVSWALVGTSAAFAILMSVAVGRELHLRHAAFARVVRARGGGGGSGCSARRGAVRYAWPAISVPATVTAAGRRGARSAARAAPQPHRGRSSS